MTAVAVGKKYPEATMAEASLLAQKAATEEAKNAAETVTFQREDYKCGWRR